MTSKHEQPRWRTGWFRAVVDLLNQRHDLRGVSTTADYLDEAVRWSA